MRKRSKYRPKGVILDVMNHVLAGMKIVGQIGPGTTLKIKNHDALNRIRLGQGTRSDIDTLISAFNITEALAMMRIGEDWHPEIRAAQDALLALGRRGVDTNRFIVKPAELTAFNLAMEVHDAQLDACTVAELEKAMDLITELLRHKKARSIVEKQT